MTDNNKTFGTSAVFFTAISTILGAILFLRFGYSVGILGFWGTIVIILIGHLVTIPTALAISELATNKRVEGGGEYFIISRSFGLNIGTTIGIALFLSQAVSVAFYMIAFVESFGFAFNWFVEKFNMNLPRQVLSLPLTLLLAFFMLKKGSSMGMKSLYIINGILAISMILFFAGTGKEPSTFQIFSGEMRNMDQFFVVFAIVFPAFTGMTAGVGLSGNLKNPSRSIPIGTVAATLVGMITYIFISWKLASYASVDSLTNNQLVMSEIAIGGVFVIPFGLAACTLSSAIGSLIVAPRTLQALAGDQLFSGKRLNKWLNANDISNEPRNATIVTVFIALIFVAIGDVNSVARIISMFFMVTYGSLCLISFLNHFGSSPSYRPSFRSRWYLSLAGFLTSVYVMLRIDFIYAISAIISMIIIYFIVNFLHKDRKSMEIIFANAIFQLNRNLQVYIQKVRKRTIYKEWRPSSICITDMSFERKEVFRMLNWLSYKYGFGTFIHLIQGYFSKASYAQAQEYLSNLRKEFDSVENHVYIDTIISPSYTSAIAQAIQLPGIAGMENNMLIFDSDINDEKGIERIIDNYAMVNAGGFDVLILRSGRKAIDTNKDVHVWIKKADEYNSNLMILLSFIICSHPDWKKSDIHIYMVAKKEDIETSKQHLNELIVRGRLPITLKNIKILEEKSDVSVKQMINIRSANAGLVISGFRGDHLKHSGRQAFEGYEVDCMLFVNSHDEKTIE